MSGVASISFRVYGCIDFSTIVSARPSSITRPAYMTRIRSATAHEGEIVCDQDEAHVVPRAKLHEQLHDLSLHRHVQGGRGLVGDQDPWLVRDRHGDQHALRHAAGELVGNCEKRLRGSEMPTWSSRSTAISFAAARDRFGWCTRSVSTICLPTFIDGLSAALASCCTSDSTLP